MVSCVLPDTWQSNPVVGDVLIGSECIQSGLETFGKCPYSDPPALGQGHHLSHEQIADELFLDTLDLRTLPSLRYKISEPTSAENSSLESAHSSFLPNTQSLRRLLVETLPEVISFEL